jgi:hypothetical protein
MPLSVTAAVRVAAGAIAGAAVAVAAAGGAPAQTVPAPLPAPLPESAPLPAASPEPAPAAAGAPAAVPAAGPLPPLSEEEFAALLAAEDRDQLVQTCLRVEQEGSNERLRLLQKRLLALHPAPQPLPVVLADAEALLACRAPGTALTVLDRYGPGAGPRRRQWLLLQWRAASAALDHHRAALALDRLGGGSPERLQAEAVTLRQREDGTTVSRPALELLADHLEARGHPRAAGELLLASRLGGVAGAERLRRASQLLRELPEDERAELIELALEQAAEAGAWGLAMELLDEQLTLPPARARALERRLRLSGRLDDAYGEWRLRRQEAADAQRAAELERTLRSPRDPGGHAPLPPPEDAPAPPPEDVPPPPVPAVLP